MRAQELHEMFIDMAILIESQGVAAVQPLSRVSARRRND